MDYSKYLRDRMRRAAVERALEIIGEAAGRLSDAFRSSHPDIPWQSMKALRNVLAHEYGEIKHEQIWLIATNRIPVLVAKIEALLPEPPPSSLSDSCDLQK